MARVSVVLATVNHKTLLLATAGSILNQTYSDLELLISDDGSTDGSGLELLRRLGPDPSRAERVWHESLREETGTRSIQMIRNGILIHYLQQSSTRGPATARNRAVAACSGEYLAFAGTGDMWSPRKLAIQVDLMDAHRDIAACLEASPQKKVKKATGRKRVPLVPVEFEEILECPGLPLSGSILRHSCLDSESPFDENLPVCEEYDFWLRTGSRFQIGRVEDPLQTSPGPPSPKTEWGLERYRVYALEKAYQGGYLGPTLRHRVAEELVQQCNLLVQGYLERHNEERASFYDRKRKRFALEVAKLERSDPVYAANRTGRRLSGAPV